MEKGVEEIKDEMPSSADQESLPTLFGTMFLSRGDNAETGNFSVTDVHAACVQAHRFVFGLVFDQHTCTKPRKIKNFKLMIEVVFVLLEYYQLSKPLRWKFETALRTNANQKDNIADKPIFYLTIGELLRSRPVFEEAMRHFVGRGHSFQPTHCPSPWTLLRPSTALLAYKKLSQHLSLLSELSQSLQTIQILNLPNPIFADPVHRPSIREETRFLARAIWLDWLAARSASAIKQCAWGGAMWMQEVLGARTKLYEWWKWCQECEMREGDVYAPPCCKHGDPTAVVGRWGDEEELERTGRSTRRNGSDINFLGAGVVEDILRSYQTRMSKATLGNARARRELKWCLHEQVRAAGNILLDVLLNKWKPPAMAVDYERFYVTNMTFDKGDMPWEDEEAEDQERNEGEETQDEADVPKLEEASESWLKAIGVDFSSNETEE